MKLALYGMPERDAAALAHLVAKEFPGWTCEALTAGQPWQLPPADAYVLDVGGMGAARCTDATAQQVLQLTAGAASLLITLARDDSWSDNPVLQTREAAVQWIRRPYGADAMRAALRDLVRRRVPGATPAPAAAGDVPRRRASDKEASGDNVASTGTVAPPTPAADDVAGLSAQEFIQWVAAAPPEAPRSFFRKLGAALGAGQPFEICLTLQHSMVVFPAEDWVATNTPMAVIVRLCKSDALASVATIRAVDATSVMKRVGAMGMTIEPLEPFLWKLHLEAEPAADARQRHA